MISRFSVLFWGCITVLLMASLFFGYNAEKERRKSQSSGGRIENGSIVRLVRVLDGDSAIFAQEGEKPVVVRILGIKSFSTKYEKDTVAAYGQAAIDTLERVMSGKPVRVMLNALPKDRYGRFIAVLYTDNQDVGLKLVRDGLALVYTVYPFPAMSVYLQEQETAKAVRRGFWANTEVAERAKSLIAQWQGQTQ